MLPSVWHKSLFWTNSQVGASANVSGRLCDSVRGELGCKFSPDFSRFLKSTPPELLHVHRFLAIQLLFMSTSDAWDRRPLVSALLNSLLRSHAEVAVHFSSNALSRMDCN